ncbi:isovaleryl-CoA dehydrogenase [Herbaspirillum sp. alder98]|uniref:isovaleryl-CoA dehydrogenase n=1 Tax=Herbaspirillum sp. alder98 TaxID=2913096 RepID=UPI001CD8A3D0|nr:isovaleryl-CoA dehydrogenase [Herbaspirillum sp. alder98]MCA1325049.1 isovaleryl-CoA dehydrogenase [Herbaspirillum sp. alder98]
MQTHDVSNQVAPLAEINLYQGDLALQEGVRHHGAGWHAAMLQAQGAELGSAEVQQLAELANRYPPELLSHDRTGHRIDAVQFHPAWHALLELLRRAGLHALPWMQPGDGAHVARAAGVYLHGQVEAGSLCPNTMTFAAIPVLQQEPELFAQLQSRLFAREHDGRDLPLHLKRSALIGMGMTEKQGGSDVRSNASTAIAVAAAGRGAAYLLSGHKWFFSAPMCDAHLMLARSEQGLSCFFVPRWLPDGGKNPIHIQRLKDKLGNRSNASAEVEFDEAWGLMIGDEGRGIATIIEMANHTRLDCVIGSAALMRQALVQAIHHARHRSAFGRHLAEHALMRNVLADLALESEAATQLMLRLAHAFDAPDDPLERAWKRIVTPAAKFWICKRALEFTGECMEVWGGNGYVETGPMARLYREAPVNSIWEGSGNVMCLDVLRAIEREAQGFILLLEQLDQAATEHPMLARQMHEFKLTLSIPAEQREGHARRLVQQLVLALQAMLMLQHAPATAADAFLGSRGERDGERIFGTLDSTSPTAMESILQRAWPAH